MATSHATKIGVSQNAMQDAMADAMPSEFGHLLNDVKIRRRFSLTVGFPSAYDAMLHAAQRRLRPIVMTALAAVCGMLPLAFALGAGSEMLQPLAIAVIGGLTISMVLSLVITPLVYFLLTRNREQNTEEAT